MAGKLLPGLISATVSNGTPVPLGVRIIIESKGSQRFSLLLWITDHHSYIAAPPLYALGLRTEERLPHLAGQVAGCNSQILRLRLELQFELRVAHSQKNR